MPNWAQAIYDKLRGYIPDALLRYLLPLAGLSALTGIDLGCHALFGPRPVLLYAFVRFLMLIVLLGSSWLGFGPGVLLFTLASFVLPLVMSGQRARRPMDLVAFGLVLLISLLISWIGRNRRQAEAALRRAAEDLEGRVQQRTAEVLQKADSLREQVQLLDLAHDAILSLDWDGRIGFWNKGASEMYGWEAEDAIGKISHDLLKTQFACSRAEIESKLAAEGSWYGELVHQRRDGTQMHVASRWALRKDAAGKPSGYLEINTDITERIRIEEQLRQTQKLESLGVLAGGVAHDFNNLLTGIMGNASMVLDRLAVDDPDRELLQDVLKASEQAANLTRQLLAYAGKGRFVLRLVNLSKLVRDSSGLTQTSIPKHVQLRLQLAENLPPVEADPGQMQQIIMNLVINGAEAIGEENGVLLVRTSVQQVDRQYIDMLSPAGQGLAPGEHVCLEVHDTGHGMDEATMARIFDPFFTTKFTGRGLGLSAVLGIVRSHRGALKVYSQPGHGTTFKLLFPAARNVESEHAPPGSGKLAGSGTVLVVDDEAIVRKAAVHALERFGYRTLTAEDGATAVAVYRRFADTIDAVLLDLNMPLMNGEEALRALQAINPAVRVLLSTGYNEVEAVERFAGKGLAGFVQKPYTAAFLAEKMKEVVGESRSGAGKPS